MRLTVFLATWLILSGCGPFRTAKAPLPPPTPMPARIPDQVANTEPAPAPKTLPPPPAIPAPAPDARPTVTAQMSIPSTPTAPPPRSAKPRKTVKRATTPTPPPVAAAPAETPEETPAPTYRLGELRSPEENEKLRRQAERMVGICNAALSAAEGRALTAMQVEMVNRVRTFAQQARESMEKDPREARSFAAKGRTFAEALLAELK